VADYSFFAFLFV